MCPFSRYGCITGYYYIECTCSWFGFRLLVCESGLYHLKDRLELSYERPRFFTLISFITF
jgi:hypothetical protein